MIEKNKIIRYMIIGSLFCIIACIFSIRANLVERNYQFSGVIERITYNEKRTPIVIVNGKKYVLLFSSWKLNEKMEPGDSLIKVKNSRRYKLVKKKTREVFFSDL